MSDLPNIIGVIDLLNGVAVRAIGGRRDEYKPVQSRICASADPVEVALAFRRAFGINQLYIADLDAIRGRAANHSIIAQLLQCKFEVTCDVGFRSVAEVTQAAAASTINVVVSLESFPGRDRLAEIVSVIPADRLWFSLDLVDGLPKAEPQGWGEERWTTDSPLKLAASMVSLGITRLIVLDLATVGTASGPSTADLCRAIKAIHPELHLWTGGGVRSLADARKLRAAGVDGVLVAAALHDQTLRFD